MGFNQKIIPLIVLFLAFQIGVAAQHHVRLDYSSFPVIKVVVDSIDRTTCDVLVSKSASTIQSQSLIQYGLDNVISIGDQLPKINYYGVKKSDEDEITIDILGTALDPNYFAEMTLNEPESPMEEPARETNTDDSLKTANSPTYDTLLIQARIWIDTLYPPNFFKKIILVPQEDSLQRISVGLESSEDGQVGTGQLYKDSETGKIFPFPPQEGSSINSIDSDTACCDFDFFVSQLALIKYPAIFLFNNSDSCVHQAINYLESSHSQAIVPANKKRVIEESIQKLFLVEYNPIDARGQLILELEGTQNYSCEFDLKCLNFKPVLSFKDRITIIDTGTDTLVIDIQLEEEYLAEYFAEQTRRDVLAILESGGYFQAIDTLEARRVICSSNTPCIQGLEQMASEVFLEYHDALVEHNSLSFDTLVSFESHWTGSPIQPLVHAKERTFNSEFEDIRKNWSSSALITYALSKNQSLSTKQRADLEYAYFKTNKDRNPLKACTHLSKYASLGFTATKEDVSFCVKLQITNAYDNKDYQSAYKIGIAKFAYIKDSPGHRYMLAVSARKTGNLKDALKEYTWIETNWSQFPSGYITYEECLEQIRELSFATGDFKRAFALSKRNFINSDSRNDLELSLSSFRYICIKMASDCSNMVSNITNKMDFVSEYLRFKPNHLEEINVLNSASDLRSEYPAPLISFPHANYHAGRNIVCLLDKGPGGSFLEFIQNDNVNDPTSKSQFDYLSKRGYNGNYFDRLIQNEKEIGLEFFGMAFKILANALISYSESEFHPFMEDLIKKEPFAYFEYQLNEETYTIGNCPDESNYTDKTYLQVYRRIINYQNTTVSSGNMLFDEIAVPLKKDGKKIGYIRIGILLDM